MATTNSEVPFYLKMSQILIGLVAFFYVLYIGQDILLPIIYATVFAILLNPVINFLCNKGIGRVLAIFLTLFMAILLTSILIYFISMQLATFGETFPALKLRFVQMFKDCTSWVSETFNIRTSKINTWLDQAKEQGLSNSSSMIGQTLSTLGGLFSVVFLLPVYIFMILFYKPLLLDFIGQLFPEEKHEMVHEVLTKTKSLIQSYLVGLLLEAAIVATMNSTALLLLGIEYAILLGIIGALLNLIPYIGGIIAIALPMLVALATKEPVYALFVFAAYLVVQLIDNNFIVPKVVASKVKINALVSIVVVLIGGALWGVAGMFIAIPLTAILKVIFDRIDSLKPFGFLLGDTMPQIGKDFFRIKKKRKVKAA
jgi:predicted PurR-regulated permease PerM